VRGRFLEFGGEKLTHGKSDAISGPLSGGALTWRDSYFSIEYFDVCTDSLFFWIVFI
jgi:hypothetical protein